MTAKITELTEQLIAASKAGDHAEAKRITDQISELGKPRTFSECWNYDNTKPPEAPGSFESVWQFTRKGRA